MRGLRSALVWIMYAVGAALVAIVPAGSAQPNQKQVSSSPFTEDQVAVYQAFLADYRRGRAETLNVAELTDILQPDEGDYGGCMKGFPKSSPTNVVHRLTHEFATQNHLRAVDPKTHKVDVPEDGILNGQSVEEAVKSGFKSGLLTLSEIIFDKNRRRAALHFSFTCGELCGHTETVVYEKRRNVWKASRHSCGFGIS